MERCWAVLNNQYLIIKQIGAGGFASVYKAWDSMLQKFVAIKKIDREYSTDTIYADMFQAEARNTAKLEHENIVRIVNFIRNSQGNFYVVMDFVKGVDLGYLMRKCRENSMKIPHDITLYIISEIVKALDYAHCLKNEINGEPLNIIHRDVSPGNIMLYFDGRVKLNFIPF